MYKVIIVDDEPWVLKGILNTFNWEHYGFQVIAETTEPQIAFDTIVKEEPDVVMTDIRMPEISGIDLMKMSRKQGCSAEFIIISGVADFHYAQEGIRVGCFDYMLKPLKFSDADALLERLALHLLNKTRQSNERFLEAVHQNDTLLIQELLKPLGFHMKHHYLQAIYMNRTDQEIPDSFQWLTDTDHLFIKGGPDKTILLLNTNEDYFPVLKEQYSTVSYNDPLVFGVSSLTSAIQNIPTIIEEAYTSMHSIFLYPNGGVFIHKPMDNSPNVRKEVHHLCEIIQDHSAEQQLRQKLEEIPDIFRSKEAGIREVSYFWNQLIASINSKWRTAAYKEALDFMDHTALVHTFSDIDDLCIHLKQLLTTDLAVTCTDSHVMMNENFKELLEYVDHHFADELRLNELARKFYINYTYCCDLFQKITQSTFTEYLTQLRMKKTIQLLKTENLTISDICQQAGYNDYSYFIKVFKKWYGMTPSRYRKQLITQ
ncbi:response regulator transcription factor [Gracilibacillus phocaeensis]|uniref:response regulator transcription factor n=1 Tax=Gracilibacillus phocaeensis TaxID=2042304 RepID=UPI0013EF15B4|nr:helix-turn-helix domain-containing protein [Gracilibacillus phocaeensis]